MSDVSFPHPVLGNGDDISVGTIDCELHYQCSAEAVELRLTGLTTGNPTIDSALREERAAWLIRVQCARTYYRKIWKEQGPDALIRIDGTDLEGSVEIDVRVCSTQSMQWLPDGTHTDYENLSFQLADAEVLALGDSWRIHVDKDFDPLKAPLASWMRIVEGQHDDGPFEAEFEDDLVTIRLSRRDWKEYGPVRDRAPAVLHSSIVLPVLMQALLALKENNGERWKGRLRAVLDERNLSPEPPLQTAQTLLAEPLGRSLRELNVRLDGDEG